MAARLRCTAALVVALQALAPAARADRPAPTPDEVATAKREFSAAERARKAGDFARAAAGFLAAFAALPDAEFLFNAGKMFKLAGELPAARRYLADYLARDPDGRGATEARALLAELDARQLADPIPTEPDSSEPDPSEPTEPGATTLAAHGALDQPAAPATGARMRWVGLGMAGAGLLAVGVGGLYGLRARRIEREAADWTVYDPAEIARGDSAESRMIWLTATGASLMVAGGVVYLLGRRTHGERAASLTARPLVGPRVVGLGLEGAF